MRRLRRGEPVGIHRDGCLRGAETEGVLSVGAGEGDGQGGGEATVTCMARVRRMRRSRGVGELYRVEDLRPLLLLSSD